MLGAMLLMSFLWTLGSLPRVRIFSSSSLLMTAGFGFFAHDFDAVGVQLEDEGSKFADSWA